MAKWNTEQIDSDKRILFIILLALSASLLVWTCILVYDIQKDVNQIKKSLLEIEEILEPIEHIDDPVGLTQHMKFRPMQKEYPEANFLDGSTVSDEPLPIVIETDISTETNQ